MGDLVVWLRAQLDDDERIARATVGDRPGNTLSWGLPASATVDVGGDDINVGDRAIANHIAAWDPARVLREVDATRRLIRAHAKWCEGRCEAKYPEGGFDAAHFWNIKLRAEVYADRPGYREEWRP